MKNYNTNDKNVNFLSDMDKKGKERPWKDHKMRSLELSQSYSRLGLKNKFTRIAYCGSLLEFRKYTGSNLKLHNANFCKVRLCPMCAWRRSIRTYSQVSKVMNEVQGKYRFLFLTLTCKNVIDEDLNSQIDILFHAFNKLSERKPFKKSIKGWFRALEVTHNIDLDTYHPHFHIILVVSKSYFTDKAYYISQEKWTAIWKSCLKCSYTPIVDIRTFKSNNSMLLGKSIAETAKYTVKSNDYIVKDVEGKIDEEKTDRSVWYLDGALSRRRLIAYGGILKDIHKRLNLKNDDEEDLIHTSDEEEIREDLEYIILRYRWGIGYNNYIMLESDQ